MGGESGNLAERLRDLRRRHFGAPGRETLARALGVTAAEVERWERGAIPPADALVRICELTGEDLQWLLTGQASRSTVVISGARNRHRDLITRIAAALEADPALAAPLDSFFELLTARSRFAASPALDAPQTSASATETATDAIDLIQILDLDELDDDWTGPGKPPRGGLPTILSSGFSAAESRTARILEPASDYTGAVARAITLVRAADESRRSYIRAAGLAEIFPGIAAVNWPDDSMTPMFGAGDTLMVGRDAPPQLGRPALVKLSGELPRCRVWLGGDADEVHLGRVRDGATEAIPRRAIRWSVEVFYRVLAA